MTQNPNTQLAKAEKDKPPVAMNERGIVICNTTDLMRFSELIRQSQLAPKALDTVQKIFVAVEAGMELGMTPMQALRSMAVVNGKPFPMGDGAMAVVRRSGKLAQFATGFCGDPKGDDFGAWVETKRKDSDSVLRTVFTVGDARRAGLWGKAGPWQQYPKRMLYYRALGFNLRDQFPDALLGLAIAEEAGDFTRLNGVTTKQLPPAQPTDPLDDPPLPPGGLPPAQGKVHEGELVDPETGEVIEDDPGMSVGAEAESGYDAGKVLDNP
mgnify:CR=1 FL=1